MYLAELELHGFKSFAQKTVVKFGNGITAIVGPNGCGKSNIVDALRWALGEQRPTLLRSSAMTNVIFNGTASKKPLGLAEVSITIHNNKGLLPTEFNDITITRRLYRSGDSEYLLNRVPCRLRDIVDLFMDTGMGSNAYSVIELKMVEEILADKNNDRRRLFEEAAGVTKYKEKRKQTIKKLDETRADMLRVEDILVEIRKKVKSLQIQAGRAQRAKQYEEDLERYDKALSRHEFDTIQGELGPLQERILNADREKEDLQRALEQSDQQLLLARETLATRETDQGHALRQVSRLENEIRDAETRIKIAGEKVLSEESVITRYENDVVQSEVEIRELKKNMTASETALAEAREKLQQSNARMEEARTDLDTARAQVNGDRKSLDELGVRYRETNTALNALQSKKIRLESRLENQGEDADRLRRQIEQQQNEVDQLREEDDRLRFALAQAQEAQELAESRLVEAQTERERLSEQLDKLKDEQRATLSRLDALRNEISLLDSMMRSDDAYPASVRFLRQHWQDFDRLEVVADIFSTRDELAVALEAALGDAVNYIIVDSVAQAEKAFALLREHKMGKATIIPLELLEQVEASPIDAAFSFEVSCGKRYERLKQLLLGNVRLYDTLQDAAEGVRSVPHTGVTRSGEILRSRAFMRSGSSHKNEGLRVGLKERIERLTGKADKTEAELSECNNQITATDQKLRQLPIEALTTRARDASALTRKLENERNTFQARKQLFEKTISEQTERQAQLDAARTALVAELEGIEPEALQFQKQLDEILSAQHALRAGLQKKEEDLQRVQVKFGEAQLAHQQAVNVAENFSKDIERANVSIAGIKKRLDSRAQSARESKDLILENKRLIDETTEQLQKLKLSKKEADEALAEAEEATARQRGRINLLDEDLRDIRRKRDINLELVHHLEMAKSKLDMQAKAISDHIWETYGLLMEQVTEPFPEDTDAATVKETISMLRERLKNIGEVNKLAIEEYDVEKERLDTYETQIADLVEAEDKLRQTISEINQTANARFSETFAQIRENFRNVFHTLFDENDHCDLILEDNAEDPLDRKINIVANPRGKRPSNIEQLSGGEKTLTAIALLFAIYLVKPSPFCILDEVDAPLDDANINRFTGMIKKFSRDTQFIIITHNKKTMEKSEMLYGVTMPETGISKLVAVRMDEEAA